MKKIIFILSGVVLVACKSATNSLRPETVLNDNTEKKEALPQITSASVATIMNFLASDELQGRNTGEEGLEKAAVYIEDMFKQHNIAPYFSSYRDQFSANGVATYNVVGVLEGNDPVLKEEFIVVGAHYDHVGTGKAVNEDTIFNGANDNASGTTAVLELAKYFAHAKTNKRSLLFVLFSAEERGLLGSAHLAKKLKSENFNLYTVVNFEMIGVPMSTQHKTYITGYEMSNMAAKINEYAGKNTVGFLATAKQYQLFRRSDNYPFFEEFGVPSQTICTFDFTNFDYYHHVDDEVSEMDFVHMADIINEMILPLERMASTPDREIKMNE